MKFKISNSTGKANDTRIFMVFDDGRELDLRSLGVSRIEILPLLPGGTIVARMDFLYPDIYLTGVISPNDLLRLIYDSENATTIKQLGRGRIF